MFTQSRNRAAKETAIASKPLCNTAVEKLLEKVISVLSVPRPCNENQLPLRESPETAVTRVGDWCDMAASL
jgi:hypothetical protein